MNISSVSSSSTIEAVAGAVSTGAASSLRSTDDSSSLSGPAELFKKLESLAKTDPAKFKEVATNISKKLTEEADSATDPNEKQMINDLGKKFAEAGQTGDVSSIKPPQGGPPGGGPPSGGGPGGASSPGGPPPGGGRGGQGGRSASSSDGSSASSASKTYEPADANKDGKVSLEEQLEYDAQRAAKATDSSGLAAYKSAQHSAAEQKAEAVFSSLNSIVDSAFSG